MQTLMTPSVKRQLTRALGLIAWALSSPGTIQATEPLRVAMTADRWEVTGADVEFQPHKGVEALLIRKGTAVLKDVSFRDGTIEFDVEPTGSMGAGVGFRRRDADTYEDFYLRPKPSCAEAWDCMQYAPRTHGVLLWDLFPQYQSPAPLRSDDWNHVKMVVSGYRMDVYINGATSPTLKIGRLAGDVLEGGILLQAPGFFSHVVITPGATARLSPEPEADAAGRDPRMLTSWMLAPYSSLAADREPQLAEIPGPTAGWQPLRAELGGLMNVSRQYGVPVHSPDRALTWLRTSVVSDVDQTKKAAIGWTREVWVFVNGKQVYADKNFYNPAEARKAPDGRCSLENGTLMLPFIKGPNDVVVAVANNFYGWGLMMRLDDMNGIHRTGN